ncbi:MAG: AraC-like DNA-binding protein [Bermanella sp.]|jgi:AraC-like DNA-binding protein
MLPSEHITWYENDERIYPAHFHGASLMDILLARNIDSHYFLKNTCLFYDDVLRGAVHLNAQQFCQIIENSKMLYQLPELSFRWGHGMFPGHFDGYSQLLCHASNIRELANIFMKYPTLTPMLGLSVWEDNNTVYFQWRDAIGLGSSHKFVIEAFTTAFISLINWCFSEKLPWRYGFSFSEPKYLEEYDVNLGDDIQFSLGIDVMMLDKNWLDKPFPSSRRNLGSHAALTMAHRQCNEIIEKSGFIEAVLNVLKVKAPNILSLIETADEFNMSSATFKRKLKKHGWSFQRLQDQARLQVSLYLMQAKGFSNSELADFLNIADANNFRRAFKRWSGMTPTTIREKFICS